MTMRKSLLCIVAITASSGLLNAAPPDAKGIEFFEKKIRPVLVQQCYSCHSEEAQKNKKLKGGLLLDSQSALLTGGDSGPSIVLKKPAESLLYQTLTYDGDVKMPPKGKLDDQIIADFKTWIEMGAPDPRQQAGPKKQVGLSIEEGKQFWSFKAVQNHPIPEVADAEWNSPIDRLIKATLEKSKLQPAPLAEKATLARRLYFDLTGLPPTTDQLNQFLQDSSPKAVERLVDELLASPAFGERWGRHWLDVARYAESLTLRGFILKEAWRYRDYVIRSFNEDRPFNQFIREQISGDLLPSQTLEQRERQLVATSFLMLGNTNLEEQDKKLLRMDVVDEQLDVITKGFLAQTVTCARCHDHKFDPIPTKDYYALAGILRNAKSLEHANVSKWIEIPLPVDPNLEAKIKQSEQQIAAIEKELKSLKSKGAVVKGIMAVKDVPGIVIDDTQAKKVGSWQDSTHSGHYIGKGYTHDQNDRKGEKTITFQPELPSSGKYEVRLAYSPGMNRSKTVPVTVFSADGEMQIAVDMTKVPPMEERFISLGTFRFEKAGQSFVLIDTEGTTGHVTADAVTFIPQDGVTAKVAPGDKKTDRAKVLEAELKSLQASAPKRPMTMGVLEEKTIEDAKVHIRGSVGNLGETVPRGFLQAATSGSSPLISKTQSGRKELADWIASPANPLTARVIVNRTWHWLFGAGIVRTVDNFGVTGEKPSHPELLDHLATQFMQEGWSMKKLIRQIVLSRTYLQASIVDPKAPSVQLDPDNKLFSRANRRRLEGEAIRDTILVVSGQLNSNVNGATYPASLAADYSYKSQQTSRSIYLPMFRNSPPELLDVFDQADMSLVTGKRNTSTVAPQALFMLNNKFVEDQAVAAAKRLEQKKLEPPAAVDQIYRECLGRVATSSEREVALRYFSKHKNWAAIYHALFASADFRFIE
jgi:cytochrome c553